MKHGKGFLALLIGAATLFASAPSAYAADVAVAIAAEYPQQVIYQLFAC